MSINNVMPLFPGQTSELEYGVVQSTTDNNYIIKADCGIYTASRAFSCLLLPQIGDKIMCAFLDKQYYILAIIERPNEQHMALEFPADVSLRTQNGALNIHASKTVGINSADDINMTSKQLNVIAEKSLFNINSMMTVAKKSVAHIQTSQLFSKSIETIADRSVSSFKFVLKNVEGLDQTKAGEMISSIKNLFSLRSRQAAILAKKDIKIDAQRIHMG